MTPPNEGDARLLAEFNTENARQYSAEISHLRSQVTKLEAEAAALRELLKQLHGLVWRESPSLLNEDSGGDSRLDLAIREALSPDAGKRILAVVEKMRELVAAVDSGSLEMNSPEIGGEDGDPGIPPHPWHEEWLYHTREALSALGWEP